jgi:hypothetical protein
MPDEWQVGDLAECIATGFNGWWYDLVDSGVAPIRGPQRGDIDRVTGVVVEDGFLCLRLERWPENDESFDASEFRKVQPPKHEACEPDFVTLLKRREKVDA